MVLKVLVADDSAFMRNMVKAHISSAGAEIVGEAVDGLDAVSKVEELQPNMVFLDIMMPNMTGVEALKKIKANHPDITAVMCTSVGQEKIVAEAVESGASEFILKPFKPEDIKEVISKYMV